MRRLILLALVVCVPAFGAPPITSATSEGTATITSYSFDKGMEVFAVDWLSNATGDVTAVISGMRGTIERVVYNPDAGSASPTTGYDVFLNDVDGFDTLIASGVNLSQTVTTSEPCMVTDSSGYWPVTVAGDLTFVVDDAGAANAGVVRFYIKP